MDVKEKLNKAEKKLESLKNQRNIIDEKIKKAEKEVESCKNIINQIKFDEMRDVFSSKGLSVEEILKAVEEGDFLSLQERMEEKQKNTSEEE